MDEYLGHFRILAIVNNAVMNVRVQISFEGPDFIYFVKYPEVGLLDQIGYNIALVVNYTILSTS